MNLFPVIGKKPAPGVHWPTYDGPPPPDDQPAGWRIPPDYLVVDIDGDEGWESVAEADPPLPGTPLWWYSLSGKGAHYVYAADQVPTNRRVLPGVDVKTAGGYVVVPPDGRAKLAGGLGDVSWAPGWAYERTVPKPERPAPERAEREPSTDGWRELPTRTSLEDRCERITNAPEGQRNELLNREAYLYGLEHGDPSELDTLANSGVLAGLERGEAWATAASGLERGVAEYVDPLADVVRTMPAPAPAPTPVPAPGETYPRAFRTTDAILSLPKPTWLLPGRIMSGALNMLSGFPKSGKSILSLEWAWEAARLGRTVLYVPAEHEQQFRPRSEAYLEARGRDGWDRMFWWYEEMVLGDSDKHTELVAALVRQPVDLVVVDTFSAATGGFDENAAGDHVKVAENAGALTRTGAAVLLVHHAGHDKSRATGSAAQARRPVVMMNLEREEGTEYSKLTNKASRFAGAAETQWYKFSKVRLPAGAGGPAFGELEYDYVCEEAEPPEVYEGESGGDKRTKEDY